jgi:septal ring factor EnvC (AmiA/AmiB activator)
MKGLSLFLFFVCAVPGWSQNAKKQALQKEYNSILSEIRTLQKTIEDRKKERTISLREVELINKKIEKRKTLISNIEVQMSNIEGELSEKQVAVLNISTEVNRLLSEYKKLILWLNKNQHSTNKLAFVLESHSFKEAYNRIKYIKKYGDYRARQSVVLRNQIDRIMDRISSLKEVKEEKANLLATNKYQQTELIGEKKSRDQMVSSLSAELKSLKKKVDEKNKQAAIINERIKKVIEVEIRKQREKLMADLKAQKMKDAAKRNEVFKEKDLAVTDEDVQKSPEGILSNSFQLSRGHMPWPVNAGNITSKYGRQPHPADASIFVDNNGVDIKTTDNAEAKSIYRGMVVRVFQMPTYMTCVMIKHGDFFTVYSYLKSVNVREGDRVDHKQVIGKCGKSDQHGYSLVNLQVWHSGNKQNPESWIKAR